MLNPTIYFRKIKEKIYKKIPSSATNNQKMIDEHKTEE
jgi:hypothetical protein